MQRSLQNYLNTHYNRLVNEIILDSVSYIYFRINIRICFRHVDLKMVLLKVDILQVTQRFQLDSRSHLGHHRFEF